MEAIELGALNEAIEICGSQAELARRLGVKQQIVWSWIHRSDGRIPPEYCRAVEDATGGKVTRYRQRPDVFGPAPDDDVAIDTARRSDGAGSATVVPG